MHLLLLFPLLLSLLNGQFCHYGAGIFVENGSQECLNSAVADLANCCFTCINANGSTMCGSLLQLGGVSCAQTAVYNAAQLACNGTAFNCYCNVGHNDSEFILAGTPTEAPTEAPTNTASYYASSLLLLSSVGALLCQ